MQSRLSLSVASRKTVSSKSCLGLSVCFLNDFSDDMAAEEFDDVLLVTIAAGDNDSLFNSIDCPD